MSVTWGLDLSSTAVRLMCREGGVWREEAREPLGGDDMDARLKALANRPESPAEVDVFLPRDQILYTDIEIADLSNARAEIETAMEGRTPYDLADLRLDWNIDDDGTAQIAAIATDTLEEAATFVRDLGLHPAAFSALAEAKDFPRNPGFGRLDGETPAPLVLTEDDTPAPTFVSARPTSQPQVHAEPPAPVAPPLDSAPVVQVDDATPVMQVEEPAPPLDPGLPVALPAGPPRVRTDVGAAAAKSRAQSLTAPAPIRVRQRDRALPTPLLAGLAAALCLGIAAIIWSIFPNSTGTLPEAPGRTGTLSEDTTGAIAPAPRPTEQAVVAPTLSDTPPDFSVVDLALAAPSASAQPAMPPAFAINPPNIAPGLDLAVLSAPLDLPPTLGEPRDPRPETLVGVELNAPALFDLAVLPATASTPSANAPGEITYPGAAITTPLASVETTPDATVPQTIAALPPELQPGEAVAPAVEPETDLAEAPTDTATLPEDDIAALQPEAAPEQPSTSDPAAPAAALPIDTDAVVAEAIETALPAPTELARSVPDSAPRSRPGDIAERVERQQYNGYTLAELADREPPARPSSEQVEALLALSSRAASEYAVANSLVPRLKPDNFDNIVASIQVQQQAQRRAAAIASNTPDTSAAIEAALAEDIEAEEATAPRNSPRLAIPSSASVSRQATIEDAIRLNRINLIGVYGAPSDRRALLRLSSGRYVKVKVGDRVDGGTVSAISASALQYQKGSRTLSLQVPES